VPGGVGELSVWVGGTQVARKGEYEPEIVERIKNLLKT